MLWYFIFENYDYNFEFSERLKFLISIFDSYICISHIPSLKFLIERKKKFLLRQNIDKRERLFDTFVGIFLREEEGWSDNMAEIARRLRCGWRLRMLTGAEGAGRRKYSLM